MTREQIIRIIAGSFIILSVVLYDLQNVASIFNSVNHLWFTLFVGVNLLQSGFTKWCLMSDILRKLNIGK